MAFVGAVFTAAVCWILGRLLFRVPGIELNRFERELLAGVSGASLLSLAVFVLCAAGIARTPVFVAFGVVLFLFRREQSPSLPALPRFWKWLFVAAFSFYAVVYLSNSLAPEHSPDGMTYHLSLVDKYFDAHGFVRNSSNLYANFPQGMEMLFLFAFAFGRHPAAATVHCLFLFTLPLLMVCYGRRIERPAAGVCAAMLVYLSPLAGIDGVSAYNDVALATVAFAMFYLLEIWRETRQHTLLIPAGLLAGFCFAIKYTGFVAVLYAVGVVVVFGGVPRLWMLAAPAAAMVVPWLVKNWMWMANPFAPFFNRWFPNPYIHISFEDGYTRLMRIYLLPSLKGIFWIVTVSGKLGGQIGPLFLLAPLALLSLRDRASRMCVVAAILFLLPYPGNVGARFLLPALPFVALGIALAIGSVSRPALAVLIVSAAVLAWPRVIDRYAAPAGGWSINHVPWKAALGTLLHTAPPDGFLGYVSPEYRLARRLPVHGRIFSTLGVAEAYTKATVLVNYYSAEGERIEDMLLMPLRPDAQPLRVFRFTFPRRILTHVRISQDGRSDSEMFSIAEVRLYGGDVVIRSRDGGHGNRCGPGCMWMLTLALPSRLTGWMSTVPTMNRMFVCTSTVRTLKRPGSRRGKISVVR